MKATIYLPSGEARALTEQQLFELHVLQERLMGLPMLCADSNRVSALLGNRPPRTLAQNGRFVAYAGLPPTGDPAAVLSLNPVAGARLMALGVDEQACPVGPVLVIETESVAVACPLGF